MHDLRDGLANIKFVEKEESKLDNGKAFLLQDPYNIFRGFTKFGIKVA